MMNGKRFLSMAVVVLIATCITTFGRSSTHAGIVRPTPQVPASAPKKAEEQFKNIQVLKGVPADQIFPTMQFITASLGVECEFCHVQNAFDKDDKKPKQIARKMMEMMFAINKDNFEGHREVTCYSCHRGNAHPVAIPTVATDEPGPAMGARITMRMRSPKLTKESTGPTADQLLDKYVQAAGGATAIDKISSRVMTGTIEIGGMSLPIEIYAKDPEKRISFTHMQGGDNVTAFNGQEGWLGMTGHPMREMHGSDLDAAAIDADLHLATHFKQMFTGMTVQGSEKIGDHNAYVVVGHARRKTAGSALFR